MKTFKKSDSETSQTLMDYLYEVMVARKLFNELVLVMRGEVAVEFAHSGAFVLGQNGKEC